MARPLAAPPVPTVRELRAALRAHGGHITLTAQYLAVARSTLSLWIAAHRLQPFASRLRADAGVSGPR